MEWWTVGLSIGILAGTLAGIAAHRVYLWNKKRKHVCEFPDMSGYANGIFVCWGCWRYWEWHGFAWSELVDKAEQDERYRYYLSEKIKEKYGGSSDGELSSEV